MGITRSDMQLCGEKLEEKLSDAQHVILGRFAQFHNISGSKKGCKCKIR